MKQLRLGASTVSRSELFNLPMTRFENKYFLRTTLNVGLRIFLLWPRKPLSLPSSVNKTLTSISVYILNTSIESHRFLLSSSIHKANLKSLSAYGKDEKLSIILVNQCCTLSFLIIRRPHTYTHWWYYTVSQKKLCPFYFYCNFGKCWPILIILSVSQPEIIST